MNMLAAQPERMSGFDALRGVAILGVIVSHAALSSGIDGRLLAGASLGAYGVQLFFVISACTIFMVLDRGMATEARPLRNFFVRRFMRIAPIYWLGIVLYTAVYGLASRGWQPGPEPWHYLLHLTLTNALHPAATSTVVPGGWSISCEVLFYLAAPVLYAAIRSFRSAVILALAAFIGGAMWAHLLGRFDVGAEYQVRSFPSQLGSFACGIVLFHALKRSPVVEARAAWLFLLTAALLSIVAVAAPAWMLPHNLVSGAFAIGAFAVAKLPWSGLANQLMVVAGRSSYSAYLVHFLVLAMLAQWFRLPPLAEFLMLVGVGVPVTITIAYGGYRFVEFPLSSLAKRWTVGRSSMPGRTRPASALARPFLRASAATD